MTPGIIAGPRSAAVRVLIALERGRTTLASEVERGREALAAQRDRALLLELAAGTLRWRNELDAVLAGHSQRPVADLDVAVRAVLRLGVYQIRHLDRVPDHAVVHQSVELVRALGRPRAAGFVNAVLRSVLRRPGVPQLPRRPRPGAAVHDQLAYFTITLSHPEWLAQRWLSRHGFEQAEAWCLFNNRAPDVTVRNTGSASTGEILAELAAAGVDATGGRVVRDAIRLPAGALGRLPGHLRGQLHVQDEGSQLVALAVDAHPGDRVLDACAAPGGKTTVLARAMEGRGLIVAADARPSRVRLLRAMLARAGVDAGVVLIDLMRRLPFQASFDRVLVDAPCSGVGTLGRDPDLKWSRSAEDLGRFADAQRTMIAHAAEAVRPGGRLVYATCSSEPDENERVVDAFLGGDARFTLEPIGSVPGTTGTDWIDERGCLRTLPFRDGLDAYFAARLVRRRNA
jgi:16S rRNA (cytosine967-C5)-methyltransferase